MAQKYSENRMFLVTFSSFLQYFGFGSYKCLDIVQKISQTRRSCQIGYCNKNRSNNIYIKCKKNVCGKCIHKIGCVCNVPNKYMYKNTWFSSSINQTGVRRNRISDDNQFAWRIPPFHLRRQSCRFKKRNDGMKKA
ncbi:piggyBac transposable element-derived protein 1-like [Vespula squamosa]|uniref:PiggyBac transposable element-derived protein 1-like n=1 Tax=Vespula squamosa TaxID=30214 RepID=A0ABD2BDE3_VESSQ